MRYLVPFRFRRRPGKGGVRNSAAVTPDNIINRVTASLVPGTATGEVIIPQVNDPPTGWRVAFRDDFIGTSLDTAKWKGNAITGTASCDSSGCAAQWDGGAGITVSGGLLNLPVRRNGASWLVSGIMQGTGTDAGFAPGYGEFHITMLTKWSPAIAPGIGYYAVAWPWHNAWTSEWNLFSTPQSPKTRLDSYLKVDNEATQTQDGEIVPNVDLTQPIRIDARRTYAWQNGRKVAVTRIWINGNEMPRSAPWDGTPLLCEPMMVGLASYVRCPTDCVAWYGDVTTQTPDLGTGTFDYVQVAVPEATPASAVPARVDIFLRGGDNAALLITSGGATELANTFKALTGIATVAVASSSAWIIPNVGTANLATTAPADAWLDGAGRGSDLTAWPALAPMTAAIAGLPAGTTPLLDVNLHYERDATRADAATQQQLAAARAEVTRRLRVASGRAAGRFVTFDVVPPVAAGVLASVAAVDAGLGALVYPPGGTDERAPSVLDVVPAGAAWNAAGALQAARRLAVRMARYAYERGWTTTDLAGLPSVGPQIGAVYRDSTNPARLIVFIQHDRGSDVVVPSSVDASAFVLSDGTTTLAATGVARRTSQSLFVTFGANVPTTATAALTYCADPKARTPGTLVTDNWHTSSVPKPAPIGTTANVGTLTWPLQRTTIAVPVTAPSRTVALPDTSLTPLNTATTITVAGFVPGEVVEYRVFQNNPPNYTWRSDSAPLDTSVGGFVTADLFGVASITFRFLATGDALRVMTDARATVFVSNPTTATGTTPPPQPPPGTITITDISNAPLGTATAITVQGLAANQTIQWAVVQGTPPNYPFRAPAQNVTANAQGVATFNATLVFTGDFIKLIFPNGTNQDSVPVRTLPNPGTVTGHKAKLWMPPVGPGRRIGFNMQFANFFQSWDWGKMAADPFGPSSIRAYTFYWRVEGFRGSGWQGMGHFGFAEGRGVGGTIMEFTTEWNNYTPPAGDYVVFHNFDARFDGQFFVNGTSIPTATKFRIVSANQEGGRTRWRVDVGRPVNGGSQSIGGQFIVYHWNFYLDQNKTPRVQLEWNAANFDQWCGAQQMWGLWGGEQSNPTWYSDYQKARTLGFSNVEEIKRQEAEWLGNRFANMDPRLLGIAFENERTENPNTFENGEVNAWHRDFMYPTYRSFLPDFTLVNGPPEFKNYSSGWAMDDMSGGDGKNKAFEVHYYPNFSNTSPDSGTNTNVNQEIINQARRLGYDHAIIGEYAYGADNLDDYGRSVAMGRYVTSAMRRGIHVQTWTLVGDGFRHGERDPDGVARIYPDMRNQMSRCDDTSEFENGTNGPDNSETTFTSRGTGSASGSGPRGGGVPTVPGGGGGGSVSNDTIQIGGKIVAGPGSVYFEGFDGNSLQFNGWNYPFGRADLCSVSNSVFRIATPGPTNGDDSNSVTAGMIETYQQGNRSSGRGYGWFAFKARMPNGFGTRNGGGDFAASGPALVLWPGSNQWPGPEVDIGEVFDDNSRLYYAPHWWDGNYNGGNPANGKVNAFSILPVPDPEGTDFQNWHIHMCEWGPGYLRFYVDGRLIHTFDTNAPAINTANTTRALAFADFANGGENKTLSFLVRAYNCVLEVDWASWNPL